MKRVIYYFTGTGNSMRAAEVIGKALNGATLVSMRADPETVSAEDADVIGFVYPVYHWTMPAPAVRFVEALKINPKAYIFAVAMPSLIVGIACQRCAELIEAKGGRLSYGNKVNCVANYVIVYPPFPSPRFQVPRMEKKISAIASEIAVRTLRAYPRASKRVLKKREKVMAPYLEVQKYADYPFTVSESCVSCGLCAKVCPCHNIEIRSGKPAFLHQCAQCMACVVNCPKRAIGYKVPKDAFGEFNLSAKKIPIVRMMGLPKGRKRYRNPYISVKDLTLEKKEITK